MALDAIDCRIIREHLGGNAFFWRSEEAAATEIAAKLGIHRNTLARRLERLLETESFLPVRPSLRAGALGLRNARAFLPLARPPDEGTLEVLWNLEGLYAILEQEGGVAAHLIAPDEASLERQMALLKPLVGATSHRWEALEPPAAPVFFGFPAKYRQALLALCAQPRADRATLAEATGQPPRTVARYAERARKDGVLVMRATRGFAIDGVVSTYVRVPLREGPTPALLAKAGEVAPDFIFRHYDPEALHLYLFAQDEREMQETRARIEAMVPAERPLVARRVFRVRLNPRFGEHAVAHVRRVEAMLAQGSAQRGPMGSQRPTTFPSVSWK